MDSLNMQSMIDPETAQRGLFLFCKNGRIVSPWHDIPLVADEPQNLFHMIVEIPRGTKEKMEINKEEWHNPIKQDFASNGAPRELSDIPPFKGYPCNYGAFPQTWEDPNVKDSHTGIKGDDDPLDVCEIGSGTTPSSCGQIKKVKPLGAFVVIDEGETDWKVIAIDVADPIAGMLQDIDDVEKCLPGLLDSLKCWYRQYKIPEGKDANEIGLGGEVKDQRFAVDLIKHCYKAWESQKKPGIDNVTNDKENRDPGTLVY